MIEPHVVIAMDGKGRVDFRDGQEFPSADAAQRIADQLNGAAAKGCYYMIAPASLFLDRRLRCKGCGEEKPPDQFYLRSREGRPAGRMSICKQCQKARVTERRKRTGISEKPGAKKVDNLGG